MLLIPLKLSGPMEKHVRQKLKSETLMGTEYLRGLIRKDMVRE